MVWEFMYRARAWKLNVERFVKALKFLLWSFNRNFPRRHWNTFLLCMMNAFGRRQETTGCFQLRRYLMCGTFAESGAGIHICSVSIQPERRTAISVAILPPANAAG